MGALIRFPDLLTQGGKMATWQGFYSSSQVCRLAGVPRRTLQFWRERGIIRPSLQVIEKGIIVDEGYSYADVTLIRIIRALRHKQISFDSAGEALRHLYKRLGPPDKGWANERVYIVGHRIYAERQDEWGVTDATASGQKVGERVFGELFEELRDLDEGASILVPHQFRKYVEIDPQVMGGEPVVKNTRVPTSVLVTMLSKYKTIDKLVSLYRPIPREAIEKAIEYETYLDNKQEPALMREGRALRWQSVVTTLLYHASEPCQVTGLVPAPAGSPSSSL